MTWWRLWRQDAMLEEWTHVLDALQGVGMLQTLLIAAGSFVLLMPGRTIADTGSERSAVERVIPLLERAAAGSAEQRQCFTCHSQALPVLALTEARRRGFEVDAVNYRRQVAHTFAHLDRNRDRYLAGKGTGGKADTAGYALWTLASGDWPGDDTTAAVAEYLLLWQADVDHWSCTSDRPPSESSDFATTYLAIRGLQAYGTKEQQERIDTRIEAARNWLITTDPRDHEDRVFRLWGLSLAGAEETSVNAAANDLLATQQDDGGWSQLDDGTSDVYATATALVALQQTGSLSTDHPVYQRGVRFLLDAQLDDGSWHVVTRSDPFQEYYETGFPHGDDQFISTAASSWAAIALLLTQPVVEADPDSEE